MINVLKLHCDINKLIKNYNHWENYALKIMDAGLVIFLIAHSVMF